MLHIQCITKAKLRRRPPTSNANGREKPRGEDEGGEASRRRRPPRKLAFAEERREEGSFFAEEKTECFRKREKAFYVFK